jgi:hypothetical protein
MFKLQSSRLMLNDCLFSDPPHFSLLPLKVKHEILVIKLCKLSDPIWLGEVLTKDKKDF